MLEDFSKQTWYPLIPIQIFRLRFFYIAVTVALVPFALVNLNFPESFTGYAMAAAFLIHVITGRNYWDWFYALLLGLLLNGAARHAASLRHLPAVAPRFSLAMLGAGSLIILGWRSSFSRDRESEVSAMAFSQSTVLLVLVLASQLMLRATGLRGLYVLDSYLLTFDETLGWRSLLALEFVPRSHFIHRFAEIAYNGFPLIAALVCAAHTGWLRLPHWHLFKVIVVAGICGFLLYLIFPAVGPGHIPAAALSMTSLSAGSIRVLHPVPLEVPLGVARNAMPSLHMAWALLIWLEARALPRQFRAIAFSYLLLTPFVVLIIREHYLIDLIVAIPFALLIQAICIEDKGITAIVRWRAAFVGILVTTTWLVLLRFGNSMFVFSPVVSWSCVILSTVTSAFLMHQLLVSTERNTND